MPYGDGILESPADRYGKTTLCMRNAKRIFKCAAYVVYFFGVLVFAVASKGSFLLMTQSLGNRLQVRFDLHSSSSLLLSLSLSGETICQSMVVDVGSDDLRAVCLSLLGSAGQESLSESTWTCLDRFNHSNDHGHEERISHLSIFCI